jgi:pimeloyl-ACP methyl ester carboxylesterase
MTKQTEQLVVHSGDVNLAVWHTRNPEKPVIVFVHGYPDTHTVWDKLVQNLSPDFETITYDVRGSGQSDKPPQTKSYTYNLLTDDLLAVINQVSPNKPVHLVTFDWGGLQTWAAILSHRLDGRIISHTTAVSPLDHIGLLIRRHLLKPTFKNLKEILPQSVKSAYWGFFQIPFVPEMSWRNGLDRVWRTYLQKIQKLDHLPSASLSQDGEHGVKIYRANAVDSLLFPTKSSTNLPTQLLIMQNDPYVPAWLFDRIEKFATNIKHTHRLDAGHWWPITHAQEYADYIRNFINEF